MAYVVDGRQHCESTGTRNKRLAQRILNKRLGEIAEGKFRLAISHSPQFSDWAAEFLESIPHPNTKRTYASCVSKLNEFFGLLSLAQISAGRIEEFKSARTRNGAGPAIINRNLAVLRRMMKVAARRRLVARSPFDEVDFLDERSVRRAAIPLTYEEQERLEAVAPPLLLTLIVLLTDTGLRVRKEALPLRWEDVNLSVGVLYVRKSKTPAGRRAALLTEHCSMTLRKWMRLTGPEFSPYVFANPKNPATYLKSVRKSWARALKAANLEWRPIYDLRSTFASRLSAEGAPDTLVAEMLGHSSASIVGTYVKVMDESRRRATRKLDDARDSHTHAQREKDRKAALAEYYANQKWVN